MSSVVWRKSVRSRNAHTSTKASPRKAASQTTKSKGPSKSSHHLYRGIEAWTRMALLQGLAPGRRRNRSATLCGQHGNVCAAVRRALQCPTPRKTGNHDQQRESYYREPLVHHCLLVPVGTRQETTQ